MMRKILIIIFILPALVACVGITTTEKIENINKISVDSMGIPVSALGFLATITTGYSFPVKNTNAATQIKILQKNDYVTTKEVAGLPNGQHSDMKFTVVTLTPKGIEAKKAMSQ
jgi:hypothetical protein